MSFNKKPHLSNARDQFIESVRRDLSFDQNGGSKSELHRSSGTVVAKVNRFNPAMDRMKGMTLIKKGEEDWLWEVEGDPNLIDRRLGGKAKRPREKTTDDDEEGITDENHDLTEPPQIINSITTHHPTTEPGAHRSGHPSPPTHTVVRATRTPKRIRTSDPLGLGGPPKLSSDPQDSGPSRNTRSKAGGSLRGRGGRRASSSAVPNRRSSGSTAREPKDKALLIPSRNKGKAKALDETDQVAEITAGIDGFSVFSNRQTDIHPISGLINLAPTPDPLLAPVIDASDWANPIGHKAKVGMWLEDTVQAGPQAPVDAPKSQAPSSIAAVP